MAQPTHRHDLAHRGLVPTNQLGTGTPSATTALFGDQTYKDLSTAYQPLDSDLTAIAALSTTAYGRALLALANAAGLATLIAATGDASWTNPTLINSWSTLGYGYPTASYRKDGLGYVHLRGAIVNGAIGSVMFTLPAGYRPVGPMDFNSRIGNAFGVVEVLANGSVSPIIGATSSVFLDQVIFLAEN